MKDSDIIERQQELLRESEQRRVSSDIRWGAEAAALRALLRRWLTPSEVGTDLIRDTRAALVEGE